MTNRELAEKFLDLLDDGEYHLGACFVGDTSHDGFATLDGNFNVVKAFETIRGLMAEGAANAANS